MNARIAMLVARVMAIANALFFSIRMVTQANFDERLVVYYPFEGNGDIITDASGEGNHGDLLTARC